MEFFSDKEIKEIKLLLGSMNALNKESIAAQVGGVKRRARQRAIVDFCSKMTFEDISLHSMKAVMLELFGVAVSNNALMRWATKGRKADDRVDFDDVLDSITSEDRERAQRMLHNFDQEWKKLSESVRYKKSF